MGKNESFSDRIYNKIPENLKIWFEVLLVGILLGLAVYSKSWLLGVVVLMLLFISPVSLLRTLLVGYIKKILRWLIPIAGFLLAAGLVIWIVATVFKWIGSIGKYEGMTAEEWFNEYDYAEAQVEDLQSELDDLKSCVENAYYYSDTAQDVYYSCL